jgi:hypothetical protein
MPQHNLLVDLFGALTLPLLILVTLGFMGGINPGSICSTYLKLVGTVLAVLVKGLFQMTTLILGELFKYIAHRRALAQQDELNSRLYSNGNPRVRVHIHED